MNLFHRHTLDVKDLKKKSFEQDKTYMCVLIAVMVTQIYHGCRFGFEFSQTLLMNDSVTGHITYKGHYGQGCGMSDRQKMYYSERRCLPLA